MANIKLWVLFLFIISANYIQEASSTNIKTETGFGAKFLVKVIRKFIPEPANEPVAPVVPPIGGEAPVFDEDEITTEIPTEDPNEEAATEISEAAKPTKVTKVPTKVTLPGVVSTVPGVVTTVSTALPIEEVKPDATEAPAK